MAGFGAENNPIQVIGPTGVTVPTTVSTVQTVTIDGNKTYKIVGAIDFHWDIWAAATVAGSEKALAGVPVYFTANGRTSLSLIAASATGVVYCTPQGLLRTAGT